ncbi:MAG: YaaR family protein [Spirochaetota bacterium]
MERIDPGSYFGAASATGSGAASARKKTPKGRMTAEQASSPEFASTMEYAVSEMHEFSSAEFDASIEQAEQALDDIQKLGTELKRLPSRENLILYRDAVKGFLSLIVSGSFRTQQHESGSNIMNRKRFTVVTRINTALERLAVGLLQTQGDQLALLERVDEIQGLLVDLLE